MLNKKFWYISTIIIILVCIVIFGKDLSANEYDWDEFEQRFLNLVEKKDVVSAKEFLEVLPENHLLAEEMKRGKEHIDLVFSPKYFSQLKSMVTTGDITYINILFKLRNFTDGAYTEYLDIVLGSLIVEHPKNFLLSLEENIENNLSSLNSILGNLGPKYVDKIELKIEESKRRYNALEKTQGVSEVIKELCLSKLQIKIYRTEKMLVSSNVRKKPSKLRFRLSGF